MSIVLELSPAEEALLRREAANAEVTPDELVRRKINFAVARPPSGLSEAEQRNILSLLDQWQEEDATDDKAELSCRDAELANLKAALNVNRAEAGMEPLFRE